MSVPENHKNRCFIHSWLGRESSGITNCSRDLDKSRKQFSNIHQASEYFDSIRHFNCSIYKLTRGNSVITTLFQNSGSLAFSPEKSNSVESSPHCGEVQNSSRCTFEIQKFDTQNRSGSLNSEVVHQIFQILVRVCIYAGLSHSRSSSSHEPIQLPDNSNCTFWAKTTLVSRTASVSSKHPNKTIASNRSSTTNEGAHKPSESRNIQTNCMATIDLMF